MLYADQIEDALKQQLKAEKLDVVTNYKMKKIDTDFSGFGGMMKLMEMLMGGKPSEAAGKKPKIAVVYAVGPIIEGKSASDMFGSSSIGSTTHGRRPAKGRRRSEGGGGGAADRQPRRLGHGQRPDLAGDRAHRRSR